MVKKIINIIKGHYYNFFKKENKLYNDRILICNRCNSKLLTSLGDVCKECGCPLSAKTRVLDEHCDMHKW